jgi:hypothetical protein
MSMLYSHEGADVSNSCDKLLSILLCLILTITLFVKGSVGEGSSTAGSRLEVLQCDLEAGLWQQWRLDRSRW